MDTKNQKPLTVVREEFKNEMIQMINNSGFPMFIVRGILEDLLSEVKQGENKQLLLDWQNYTGKE